MKRGNRGERRSEQGSDESHGSSLAAITPQANAKVAVLEACNRSQRARVVSLNKVLKEIPEKSRKVHKRFRFRIRTEIQTKVLKKTGDLDIQIYAPEEHCIQWVSSVIDLRNP